MSSLTTEEILHLSSLANLNLSEAEIKSLKKELSGVLTYFEELKKVRTDEILPTSQTTGLTDVLRPDTIDSMRMLTIEDALSGTEKVHNNSFVVPQVIDKDQ